jgi:hypothetical protein
MRQLLDHAAEHGYGLPAFNVNNLEQVQAIMAAASETDSPVIMQASAGARKYAGEAFLRHLIEAAVESYPDIPIVMHQDHGQSPAVCIGAMRLGFSSVMMDGSLQEDGKSIADYAYNKDVTRKVVDMAHAIGVTVEGELGCLGSLETMKGDKEDGHGAEGTMTREMLLTDPDQAADFVSAAGQQCPGEPDAAGVEFADGVDEPHRGLSPIDDRNTTEHPNRASQNRRRTNAASRPPVQHPALGSINPVTLRIELDGGVPLARLESPSHAIQTAPLAAGATLIELAQGAVPADRDFELVWQPAPEATPTAALSPASRGPMRPDSQARAMAAASAPPSSAHPRLGR